jgi:hypothetical protein
VAAPTALASNFGSTSVGVPKCFTVSVCQVKPSSPGFVHINALEFIVIILQLAATKTRLATMTTKEESIYFPLGCPNIPVWSGETNNTMSKSWET